MHFPEYEKCIVKYNIQKTNIVDTYKPNIKERYIVYVATVLLYIFKLYFKWL